MDEETKDQREEGLDKCNTCGYEMDWCDVCEEYSCNNCENYGTCACA